MTTVTAEPYSHGDAQDWDQFIRQSRNGTFLFYRAYMDYHSDRFLDSSFVIRDDRGDVVAVFPASIDDGVVTSHAGLSYGGLVVAEAGTTVAYECLDAVSAALRASGASRLDYKTIPWIYHLTPAEEDRHWLFLQGAVLFRRDLLTVIDREHQLQWQERRRRAVRRASAAGVTVRHSVRFDRFWSLLTENLSERHSVGPVHSLDEIALLAGRFPDSIQLWEAVVDDDVLAGTVLYLTDRVCHVQYNAAGAAGRRCGALDLLLSDLIRRFASRRFFDFGVSTESDGRHVNAGLVGYKEGFGARTVVHDFYRLSFSS